jgi:ABC-type multidrug transport system fused ATPase/permease subunit
MKTLWKIIFHDVKPHIPALIFTLLLMILGVGLEAASPWPFKFLIDNVLGNETLSKNTVIGALAAKAPNQEALGYFVVLGFFILSSGSNLLDYVKNTFLRRVIRGITFDFSKTAFAHLEGFDMGFFRNQDIGDYIYRLNYDVSALGGYIPARSAAVSSSGSMIYFF